PSLHRSQFALLRSKKHLWLALSVLARQFLKGYPGVQRTLNIPNDFPGLTMKNFALADHGLWLRLDKRDIRHFCLPVCSRLVASTLRACAERARHERSKTGDHIRNDDALQTTVVLGIVASK